MVEKSIKYYNIILNVPSGLFTYMNEGTLEIGERVVVPFGRRELTGIVFEECEKPEFECKCVLMRMDDEPLFPKPWLKLISSISQYYSAPIGLTLAGTLSEKLLNIEDSDVGEPEKCEIKDITLSKAQQEIVDGFKLDKFSRHLIHGITGSGKTEIYLEAAKKVIKDGKQVLYIVPEISLTPQLIERIASRFGHEPLSFHSKLPDKKRTESFLSFSKGKSMFLIGARSALFVPAKNLGLIIIDEEHENSFKQEESPTYHLRDMAVLYANILDIPIIMGSATPSIESIYNAKSGKYFIHKINERPNDATLPEIEIIDIKEYDMIENIISEPLFDKLSETVSKGEQAILFLNRKGYSTYLYCKTCGEVATCQNCSIGLTYYKSRNVCNCRYCNEDYKKLKCPKCGGFEFGEFGAGTEKVAEVLETMFPSNVLRIDTENSSTIKELSKTLKKFENKEAQILVGTQLVAKGLHFPSVTFVGILGIDNLLAMPDFRATERAYQLLVQVSGRAGREGLKGTVYVQTVTPDAPIFQFIKKDSHKFYDYELKRREITNYPPFSKLARLIFSHSDAIKIKAVASKIAKLIETTCPDIIIYGPAEADIFKIKNKHRFSILLKAKNHNELSFAILLAQKEFEKVKKGAMILKMDKDPYFFM